MIEIYLSIRNKVYQSVTIDIGEINRGLGGGLGEVCTKGGNNLLPSCFYIGSSRVGVTTRLREIADTTNSDGLSIDNRTINGTLLRSVIDSSIFLIHLVGGTITIDVRKGGQSA